MIERRIMIYSGRVQGVGFRMTALQLADGLPLLGTVRNAENGDVELDVEGEIRHIETLFTRLREHFGSFIRTTSQRSATPSGKPGQGIRITH